MITDGVKDDFDAYAHQQVLNSAKKYHPVFFG